MASHRFFFNAVPPILGVIAASQVAFSQDSASGSNGTIIEETHVVGVRDLRAGFNGSPIAVTVDDASQLSLERSIGDWIVSQPGVSLNGQGGLFQSYSIRGFSRARIRTEIEGVPIITDRRAGNSIAFLPPGLMSSVSVEKAASSAVYGSGAMGGVIAVGLNASDGVDVSTSIQSNDEMRTAAVLVGRGPEAFAGVSVRSADNAEAANGRRLNTGFDQAAGYVGGEVNRDWGQLRYRFVASHGEDIGRSNALYPTTRLSTVPSETHAITMVEAVANSGWLFRAYHHFQDWTSDVVRVSERSNQTDYRAHTIGGLFTTDAALLGGSGSIGVEWVGRRGVEIREVETVGAAIGAAQLLVDAEEDTLGVFIDQRWLFGDWSLGSGLRVDALRQSASTDEDDVRGSANLRLQYQPGSQMTYFAEVATAYRFPSVGERYFNGVTPRGSVLGNPDLDAETRKNAEFGVNWNAGEGVGLQLSAFVSNLDDYIERVAVSPDVVSFRNVPDADVFGFEAAVRWDSSLFDQSLSLQWQDGESRDGTTLADMNPPEIRHYLTWKHRKATVRSDVLFRFERDDAGEGERALSSALVWNVSVRRGFGRSWWGELFASNLLDEDFRGSADELAPYQPGRTIGLRVGWNQNQMHRL